MMYQKISKSASSNTKSAEKSASIAPQSVPFSLTPIAHFHEFTQVPVYSPTIQAKLTIGSPNDRYEQEADRVAAQVVQQLQRPASIQRQDELDETIQAKSMLQRPDSVVTGEADPEVATAIDCQRGEGQALDIGLQQSMGQAMGADFSMVRVHTDSQSDQLNRSIQAKAFTTGHDVFFRQGSYQPSSRGGQELIAHELTHVVQQNGREAVQRLPILGKEVNQFAGSEVIQRNIWYDNSIPEFQIDGKKPSFVGSVKTMLILASQSRDHIVPYAAIENDLAVLLNQWIAGTISLSDLEAFTNALFPNKGVVNTSYTAMIVERKKLLATLKSRKVADYEKHARALLSRLNSSSDNIRPGNSALNSSIGENLDADFLTGSQVVPGVGLTVMANTGLTILIAGTKYLRLSANSESVLWEYQSKTTQDLSFVLGSGTKTQVSSVDAPMPTGILSAKTVDGLPVVVFDPKNIGLPYYYN